MNDFVNRLFGGNQGGRVVHTQQAPEENPNPKPEGEGEEEEEELSPLQALFDSEEEEESEDEEDKEPKPELGPDGKPKPTREQLVAQRVQAIINKIGVGEEVIPENFDPSDPKQFRDVLGKIQQNTALATMSAVMEPMRVAMESLATDVKDQIASALKDFGSNSQSKTLLETTVPEVLNPEYSGLINALYDQAKKKHKKSSDAVRAVRTAVDALNISKKGGGDSDPSSGASLKGVDALNLFAPLNRK